MNHCGSWAEGLVALNAWHREHEPDVVCFQQLPHHLNSQLSGLFSMAVKGVSRSGNPDHDDGCAVFWNPNSFRHQLSLAFSFSSTPSQIGARLIGKLEPRAGQVVALFQGDFCVRIASCHWEPRHQDNELEILAAAARGRSGEILADLLGEGKDLADEAAAFSQRTKGMPSLIAGGFEEALDQGIGRSMLQDSGYQPLIGLEHVSDDLCASPACRLLNVLDDGGYEGERPMLVEVEIRDQQDFGAPVSGSPLPSDIERHRWPDEKDESEGEESKSRDVTVGIK